MNLEQLQGLKDIYPKLRLRSGRQIVATLADMKLTKDGLAVTVKTVFPPAARRRTELLVTGIADTLHVRPLEPAGLPDAQRFAELARTRFMQSDGGLEPLRLVKDADGRWTWVLAKCEAKTRATKPATDKGAS